MSYENAERETLSKDRWLFSGWYVDNVQDIDLAPFFSPYQRNCRLDWQSTVIRPWHSLFAELTEWSTPKWIAAYLRADSANDVLVVRHNQDTNKKLVTIDVDWAITEIDTSTSIASDARMNFQSVGDAIYCMNWVDDFGKLSWTTYSLPSTGIANFSPSFSTVFNSCHRASGRSDNPNKVYKSVADNYEDFNSAGSDRFTFQSTIVWLAANKDALYYFSRNSIAKTWVTDIQETAGELQYFTRWLNGSEGAVNHSAIVLADEKIFYISPNNKICVIAEWQWEKWEDYIVISHRENAGISKLMSTLAKDQSANCRGYYLPFENRIKRFFKSRNSTFNDVCITYDLTENSFHPDTQKFFYGWCSFWGLNYTISMLEPKVYLDEYWRDDEDTPIPFEYRTKKFYLWDPTTPNIFREQRALVDMNPLASLTQQIVIDDGDNVIESIYDADDIPDFATWLWTYDITKYAVGTWPVLTGDDDYYEVPIEVTKGEMNIRGRRVQLIYTNNTIGAKVRLKWASIKLEALPPQATPFRN